MSLRVMIYREALLHLYVFSAFLQELKGSRCPCMDAGVNLSTDTLPVPS